MAWDACCSVTPYSKMPAVCPCHSQAQSLDRRQSGDKEFSD